MGTSEEGGGSGAKPRILMQIASLTGQLEALMSAWRRISGDINDVIISEEGQRIRAMVEGHGPGGNSRQPELPWNRDPGASFARKAQTAFLTQEEQKGLSSCDADGNPEWSGSRPQPKTESILQIPQYSASVAGPDSSSSTAASPSATPRRASARSSAISTARASRAELSASRRSATSIQAVTDSDASSEKSTAIATNRRSRRGGSRS